MTLFRKLRVLGLLSDLSVWVVAAYFQRPASHI